MKHQPTTMAPEPRTLCRNLALLTVLSSLATSAVGVAQDDPDDYDEEPIVDRQIAVLPLAGARTEPLRATVDEALQDVAIVVPLSDVRDSAQRIGVSIKDDAALEELSKELLIDVFVRGSVRGKRSRTISLTFLDKHGEELSQRSYEGSLRGAGKRSFKKFVEGAYREALESLRLIESGIEEVSPDEAEPVGVIDSDIEEDETRPYLPLINIQAIVGSRNRDALIRLRSSDTRVYEAGFVTELGLRLHARPYGNKRRDIQGLFIDAEFAIAPFFNSVDDFGGVFDSSTLRLSADVGYRLRFGSVEIGPAVGLAVDSFSIENRGRDPDGTEAENLVIPSATYWYARGGVVADVPLMDRLLGVQLSGGFRYALGMGDLLPIFGSSGTALGFDAGINVGGALDMGFTYGVWARYVTYSLSFSGNASSPQENASSGHDRALYFGVALGYEVFDD